MRQPTSFSLVTPTILERLWLTHAGSVMTAPRAPHLCARSDPIGALLGRLRWVTGIARCVAAVIFCSRLIHACVPAIGLRSVKLCASLLPAVATRPRILCLSRGRAERSDRTDEQQDKPSHNASEGGHALLKRGRCGPANYQSLGARNAAKLQRVVGEDLKHSISEISALNPSHCICLHVDKLPHR